MKEKTFERKEELLEASLDEFTEKNFENASLNNIIKNAGISKGTFYYHFQDKQSLYLFLLESCIQTKMEFINNKMKDGMYSSPYMTIFDTFKMQARIGIEFAIAYPKYHKLSRMFTMEKGNSIYEISKDQIGSNTEAFLEDMVNKAIENRNFRDDLPKDFLRKTISFLFIHFDEMYRSEEDFELDQMLNNLDDFVAFLKNGLGRIEIG